MYVLWQYYPCVRGGRGGDTGRQVGKAASRPCGPTLPRWGRRVGMHSQVGVQGVAGHCLGYVLHNACTCCTVLEVGTLPRTVSHHSTQPSFYLLFTTVPRPSISAQVGWRATAMTKTKRGRQERDARYCSRYCSRYCTVVLSPKEVSVCLAHSAVAVLEYNSTRRAGLLAYELGKSAQYIITPTHAHSQHPPTRSHLRL